MRPAPREGAGDSTRERVLQAVLTQGPVSAAEVGRELGLTAAGVRRHLDALSADGTVEVKLVAGSKGAGRPSRRYVVSHQGQAGLGDDYLGIASDALARLAALQGESAVRSVARDRFADVERRFAEEIEKLQARTGAPAGVQERTEVLARVLDAEGFAASIRLAGLPRGRGTGPVMRAAQICQGHCPLQGLAARYPEFCEEETAVFARLLDVDVRRLSTMPAGGHVCTTHVPLGRDRHPRPAGGDHRESAGAPSS